ncbi:hypothetical protein AB833_22090 [Chromatiales bacterium (ex Bugula neritina AB1)]|nr:hypothetical protein AB833_22090 [Chromatiales bacterium (ex Bugula neritina AB1)]
MDRSRAEVCGALHLHLLNSTWTKLFRAIGDNLTISPLRFNEIAAEFSSEVIENLDVCAESLDMLAALGTDTIHQPHSKDRSLMQDTALRTMSGAGHQHFIKFILGIIATTDESHYQSTLFEIWRYTDEGRGLNLRWDPIDDRRYATRWKNPSSDASVTMRGANRLAIEALPLMTVALVGRRAETTGFHSNNWIWPIWDGELVLPVISTVLQMANLAGRDARARHELAERGVVERFMSSRITVGKFRNFTPARSM